MLLQNKINIDVNGKNHNRDNNHVEACSTRWTPRPGDPASKFEYFSSCSFLNIRVAKNNVLYWLDPKIPGSLLLHVPSSVARGLDDISFFLFHIFITQ